MPQAEITQPTTLYRRAIDLEGEAARLRSIGKRDLAARADIAARHYRDAGEAIAYARGMEDIIAEAEASAVRVSA